MRRNNSELPAPERIGVTRPRSAAADHREVFIVLHPVSAVPAPTTHTPGAPWEVLELARHLRVSERHVRRMVADGRIRSIRLGRRVLIPDDEVQRLVREGV
jgi:excisionase family DNA binding protein